MLGQQLWHQAGASLSAREGQELGSFSISKPSDEDVLTAKRKQTAEEIKLKDARIK